MRILLCGVLTIVIAGALPAQKTVSPGKERWSIKTSVPEGTDLSKPGTLIPLAKFLTLPEPPDVKTNDHRYQDKRIPRASDSGFAEGEIVRTSGWLRLVAGEPDGDFHIQISETPDTFENCLVVEVPKDDEVFVAASPEVLKAAREVRAFVISRLLRGADPTGRTLVMQGRAYVEVTGQLFFDDAHVGQNAKGQYRGKSIAHQQLPSKTVWEIHPVTKMVFAPRPQ